MFRSNQNTTFFFRFSGCFQKMLLHARVHALKTGADRSAHVIELIEKVHEYTPYEYLYTQIHVQYNIMQNQ